MRMGDFNEFEDGFSSNQQQQPDHLASLRSVNTFQEPSFINELILKVDPPAQIKKKHYSLQPDIVTGWAPKLFLPKPVHLLFDNPALQLANQNIFCRQSKHQLCFLGPRFNSTYSAWRALNVPFPYGHLNEQRIVLTDRFFVGMNPRLQQQTLEFDSLFESGNLDAVYRVQENEYNLFMRVDANTKGHLQWFYFKVRRLRAGQRYRFNIYNFQKAKTLYARGMKPYVFSMKQYEHSQMGWHQGGEDISYTKNSVLPEENESFCYDKQGKFFKLSFLISTQYQNDCLQIAYCPPYTYTRLTQFISSLTSKYSERGIIAQDYLCLSLGGLRLPLLTITSDAQDELSLFKSNRRPKNKKLIFVMGRVHPGECNGSYMAQGFIGWLCSNSPESNEIRQRYVFKVLPMANPDGVVIGNYRTGLSGRDFNRQFIDPDSQLFVEVSQLKKFLTRCKSIYGSDFSIFMDFHGHTVKKNVFTYGPQFSIIDHRYYQSRLLPKLIARRTPLFRYHSCVFKIAPSKESTARAVILKQLRIPFAYTIQGSNGCYFDHQKLEDVAFTLEAWLRVGEKIGEALFDYWTLFKVLIRKREERTKQKQMAGRIKKDKVKRILSSVGRSNQPNNGGFVARQKCSSSQLKQKQMASSESLIQDIYKEIVNGQQIKAEKCSDDELSEGRSDSQSQNNDLPATEMTAIIETPAIQQKKVHSQSQKKRSYVKILKALKKTSIGSIEQQPLEKDKRLFQITRDRIQLRKKIQTLTGTPSPVKEAESNNTAKIINISFAINPLPTIASTIGQEQRNKKVKTQASQLKVENRRASRQEQVDSFRKTYLSLQRQTLRRQDQRRKSNMNATFSSGSHFRIQQIVGRRIFTETSL